MTDGSDRWQELDCVLDRVLDGIYDDGDVRRLNEILRDDAEACRHYVDYVELHGRLAWGDAVAAQGEREMDGCKPVEFAASGDPMESPAPVPIIIQTSPDLPTPYSPLGGFVFSYAVAAVTVAIGLLIGWTYQVAVSQNPISRENVTKATPTTTPTPSTKASDMAFVGQITGMFDCQWADASTAAIDRAYVPLNRRYALASGLMEISYDSGAKVILQGPCIYEVESRAGGYLTVGRLTAKVTKRPNSGRPAPKSQTASALSGYPSAVFVVRTPAAIVTDLGTEFGVEVDKSGVSRAHVFLGRVEVRAVGGPNTKAVSLGANESAQVEGGKGQAAVPVRQSGLRRAFVREMPKSLPIALFNTGVGLKKGDPDPHWQIIARSDDPKFKPHAAVVRGLREDIFLEDDPSRSQWLSLAVGDVSFPEDVVYVFRTTFNLTGMVPSKAVLRGKFLADDRLVGIRLNGRRIPVPRHRDGMPFLEWTSFQISAGFVRGANVLEFDVLNANHWLSPSVRRTMKSRMSLRIELEGTAASDPDFAGDKAAVMPPRTAVNNPKTAMKNAGTSGTLPRTEVSSGSER
jgi:hypothetical protein